MRRGWGRSLKRVPRTKRSPKGRRVVVSIVSRVASISRSYATPEGQAVTHARQPRQRSKCVVTVSLSEIVPSRLASISWIRPRGESISSLQSR
jgi:hypothetical protein